MGVLWKKTISLDEINSFTKNSIVEKTGIRFIEKGDDFIRASMPVDERTKQPLGILHGGASVVLAETLGSMASHMTLDEQHYSVGLEIKANHLKSVSKGLVTGIVTPVNLSKTNQLWDITITDEDDKKICVSRLTMMILKKNIV